MTASLISAGRLITCAARDGDPLGIFSPGAVLIDKGVVVAVGPALELADAPEHAAATRIHHPGLCTPGLVDAHTHAAWMGNRANEYVMRLHGAE